MRAMIETGETKDTSKDYSLRADALYAVRSAVLIATVLIVYWAKNDASTSESTSAWSPLTATCAGESRNTLLVTRSILP